MNLHTHDRKAFGQKVSVSAWRQSIKRHQLSTFSRQRQRQHLHSKLVNTRPSLKASKELCADSVLLLREIWSVLAPNQSHRRVAFVTRPLPFHHPLKHNHNQGRVYDESSAHSISAIEQPQSQHPQARYLQRRVVDLGSASIPLAQSIPHYTPLRPTLHHHQVRTTSNGS